MKLKPEYQKRENQLTLVQLGWESIPGHIHVEVSTDLPSSPHHQLTSKPVI
jgi:hypothetical protein